MLWLGPDSLGMATVTHTIGHFFPYCLQSGLSGKAREEGLTGRLEVGFLGKVTAFLLKVCVASTSYNYRFSSGGEETAVLSGQGLWWEPNVPFSVSESVSLAILGQLGQQLSARP